MAGSLEDIQLASWWFPWGRGNRRNGSDWERGAQFGVGLAVGVVGLKLGAEVVVLRREMTSVVGSERDKESSGEDSVSRRVADGMRGEQPTCAITRREQISDDAFLHHRFQLERNVPKQVERRSRQRDGCFYREGQRIG